MQIRVNEKRTDNIRNETVNGLNVTVLLSADNVNKSIPPTEYMGKSGFDPANVLINVRLMRKGKIYNMISSNLGVLGAYCSILKNHTLWKHGSVKEKKSNNSKEVVSRSLFIPFFGHHNIKGDDELTVTVNVSRDAFKDGINATESSVLVTANQSIGIETAIYSFHEAVIQQNMSNESFNLGDNVVRVGLMSFELDPLKQVYKNASLSSDRLDFTANEYELELRHLQQFPYNSSDVLLADKSTNGAPQPYPNSYIIHDKDEIDQAKITINMNSQNVDGSKNMVVWTKFETSAEILIKAQAMADKHANENISKLPAELT